MENIRPVSDLRNHFSEISRQVNEGNTPVFLTKNGYGNMVVLSMETYRKMQYDTYVYLALREAEKEAAQTKERLSDEEFRSYAQKLLADLGDSDV
ncbi:MAG: type II toxin-antitoxin system Phd/YefM family antitoxin [Firmicutes bacterium]|nr:type II toxin-antitoxin system Phd/YefM family antitoxin [Bacillota bacterium]